MRHVRLSAAFVFLALVLSSCAPTGGGAGNAPDQTSGQQLQSNKTLVVLTRAEPPSLAGRPIRQLGLTQDLSRRMFNSFLTIRNDTGAPTPYLAEAVPQLNTDTWRVYPDGTMDTTYRLKPNSI